MPDYPPPYSPPPPPPGPEPLVSCPVAKSGFYVELQNRRDRYDAMRNLYLDRYANRLMPVYSAYVTNVPADENTECGRLAAYYKQTGEEWLTSWDNYFLGTTPALDNGAFGMTKNCINNINCSAQQYEWMQQVSNAQYALGNLDSRLRDAEDRLNQWIQTVYMLSQQCPVPRPE